MLRLVYNAVEEAGVKMVPIMQTYSGEGPETPGARTAPSLMQVHSSNVDDGVPRKRKHIKTCKVCEQDPAGTSGLSQSVSGSQ